MKLTETKQLNEAHFFLKICDMPMTLIYSYCTQGWKPSYTFLLLLLSLFHYLLLFHSIQVVWCWPHYYATLEHKTEDWSSRLKHYIQTMAYYCWIICSKTGWFSLAQESLRRLSVAMFCHSTLLIVYRASEHFLFTLK